MSRFIDYRNPMSPLEIEMERIGRQENILSSITPQYFSEGRPSFSPPSSNILSNLTQKSARNSIDLGSGIGASLNSGAGLLTRLMYPLGTEDIPLNTKDGMSILSDGTVKTEESLSGRDYFRALSPTSRAVLETSGVTEDQFNDITTKDEASERYNNIIRGIELDQSIKNYNKVHPHYATTTGILNFGLDVVTDPINLVSFGLGGLAKGGTSSLTKIAGRATSEVLERSLAVVGKGIREEGLDIGTALSKSGSQGTYIAATILESISPEGFVTREIIDIDGKVYTVTFKVVDRSGDTARLIPIRVEGEGLVRRTPKGLPQGPGNALMPVKVSKIPEEPSGLLPSGQRALPSGQKLLSGGTSGKILTARASAGVTPASLTGVDIAEGVTEEAARRVLSPGAAVSTAVGGGIAYDGLSQYAEYIHRMEDLGIEEEFRYNYLRGGLSAILTGGLAALGSLHLGSAPRHITNESLILDRPATLAGIRAANKVRNGTAANDARVSLIELDALTRAEKWSEAAYTNKQHEEIMEMLEFAPIVNGPAKNLNEISAEDLGRIFSNAPTFEEAKAFILAGARGDSSNTSLVQTLRQLRDLGVKLRDAKAAGDVVLVKKLRRKVAKLEKTRRTIVDGFEFREDEPGYRFKAVVDDLPLLDIYNQKSDRLSRLQNLLALRSEDLPESTQGNISKATSRVFKYLAKLGSQGTAARQYQKVSAIGDNPIAQTVARMFGAIDTRIANDFFTTPDGVSVLSVEQNIAKFSLRRAPFISTYYRVMKGKSQVERRAIGAEVMKARSGLVDEKDISNAAREILPHFSKYYDGFAEIGVKNGSLRSRLDGYVNIQFNDGVTNAVHEKLAKRLARWWRERQFHDKSDDVHFGTLIRSKVLKEDGSVIDTVKYPEGVTKKSQLSPEDLLEYTRLLDETLEREANYAIARRVGRTKGNPEDPVARAENRPLQYQPNHRASRRIEQEFWLSDDVLELGVVDTDLHNVVQSYERSTVAYMARQETMTEIFGEAVRFDDLIEVLRDRASKLSLDDSNRQIILDSIEALETIGSQVLGHRSRKATGLENILQPLLDFSSGAIRQGIVIPMLTEMSVVNLSSLFRPDEVRLLLKHMRETFQLSKVRDDLFAMSYALEYERHTDRFFGSSPFDPSHAVGRFARGYRERAAVWFGEAALTNRLKRFSFAAYHMRTAKKLYRLGDKIDNLNVRIDPNDPASLAAAARASGFGGDVALAAEFRRVGLHTKEAQRAVARFKEIDPESLYHPTNATKIAMQETDREMREAMLRVADAIMIISRDRTDRFIVTRSSGTSLRDNDTLGAAMLQFLTYPASWFNGFLKRAAIGPNHELAGYMGAYLLGEIMASMVRDSVYKGKTPEEILEEWEDDFYTKAGRIISRIPVAGPWTDFAVSPAISLISGDRPRFSLASTPSGSFAEDAMGGAISILKKVANDEPVTNQQIKSASRMIPILGAPPTQFLMTDPEE